MTTIEDPVCERCGADTTRSEFLEECLCQRCGQEFVNACERENLMSDDLKQAAAALGRKGGRSRSEAKIRAGRENIKKASAAPRVVEVWGQAARETADLYPFDGHAVSCLAEAKRGTRHYLCSRAEGHAGPHVAYVPGPFAVAYWG